MLHVCCVRVGSKYGPEYVNILYDMVRRNLPAGLLGEFVCFTDDVDAPLDPHIVRRSVPRDLSGWWAKLWLFRDDHFAAGDRVLYFDLDVVVTGRLDELAQYAGPFAILEEFGPEPMGYQSSIMAWEAGTMGYVWTRWDDEGRPRPAGGDQQWIEQIAPDAESLQRLFPGAFCSFKYSCLFRGYPPPGVRVVVFHGEPKPDNCGVEWVRMIWRVGGGSAAELELVCNTSDEELERNIWSAVDRQLPEIMSVDPHDGHAVIVGGGPSLARHIDEIRWRQEQGQLILATNGSYDYLLRRGVVPNAIVLLDARESCVRFVPEGSDVLCYLASQCHPSVFEAALSRGHRVIVWHSYNEIVSCLTDSGEVGEQALVLGGTTVGLSALVVAYLLGYRRLHVYGLDSSFADGAHHAYAQPENDRDEPMEVVCGGRTFTAAPWMVAQANQFRVMALALAARECVITVHGDGLLRAVADTLEADCRPDDHLVVIDGLWWPSRDQICRPYTMDAVRSLGEVVALCPRREIAVQAGGNVGVYARELARWFGRVITFEPDSLNYTALKLNTQGRRDQPGLIEIHQAALSDRQGTVGLERLPINCGAHRVVPGVEVPCVTLDSLGLSGCDLLMLDVEGHELEALRGAERTIMQFAPVIVVELKGLSRHYDDDDVVEWLTVHGYRRSGRYGNDVMFLPPVCAAGMGVTSYVQ